MKTHRCFPIALVLALAHLPAHALPLTLFNTPVTENFDTLASSGTSAVLPVGWSFLEIGGSTPTTYATSWGSTSSGNTYSFGSTSSTERALGAVRSGTVEVIFGTLVTNQTGAMITDLAIAYRGEQWRLGALGRVDQLDFAYSLDAVALAAGTWTDVNELDFVAPKMSGTVGALDGNAVGNRLDISYQMRGLSLASGSSLMLRWTDPEATGADDGLAIDDFSITAVQSVPAVVAETLPVGFSLTVLGGLVLLGSLTRRRPAGAGI